MRYLPKSNLRISNACSPAAAVSAFALLEGRWKLPILYHLFASNKMRFSELERAIPDASQKMLIQQLRRLETDGIVARKIYREVPPRVEYSLTPFGAELRPILHGLLDWAGSSKRKRSGGRAP